MKERKIIRHGLMLLWFKDLPNLRILSHKNNEPMLFILFCAMTVIISILDRPSISLVHIWKSIKKWSSLQKRKFSFVGAHMPIQTYNWDDSKIITTNWHYHQCLCLEARHINFTHAPFNHDDGGLLPDTYLHLVREKGSLLVSV